MKSMDEVAIMRYWSKSLFLWRFSLSPERYNYGRLIVSSPQTRRRYKLIEVPDKPIPLVLYIWWISPGTSNLSLWQASCHLGNWWANLIARCVQGDIWTTAYRNIETSNASLFSLSNNLVWASGENWPPIPGTILNVIFTWLVSKNTVWSLVWTEVPFTDPRSYLFFNVIFFNLNYRSFEFKFSLNVKF